MRTFVFGALSFVFPGIAEASLGRYRALAAWLGVVAAAMIAATATVWAVLAMIAVRLVAAGLGARRAHAARRAGTALHGHGAAIAVVAYAALAIAAHRLVVESVRASSSSMAPTIAIGDRMIVDKLSLRWRAAERGELMVFRHPCFPDREYVKRVIALAGDTIEIRCNVVRVGGKALEARLTNGEGCRYEDLAVPDAQTEIRTCSEYEESDGKRRYRVYHDADRPARDAAAGAPHLVDPRDFPRVTGPRMPPSCATERGLDGVELTQQRGGLAETAPEGDPCAPQLHYIVPPGHVFVLGDNRANSDDSRHWGSVPVDHLVGRVTAILWPGERIGATP